MVSFSANGGVNQTRTITIEVNGDLTGEPDEDFNVNLSNIQADGRQLVGSSSSGITFSDWQGTGTIVNEDTITLFISDAVLQEGDLGVSPFEFQITFDILPSRDFTVEFATEDVSTTSGTDYVPSFGTLQINAGDASATLIVDVKGDRAVEATESFVLRLGNLSDLGVIFAGGGSTLGGVGTILNDDLNQRLVTTTTGSVGSGSGQITIMDPVTGDTTTITPFVSNFVGNANVATGDFNGDGRAEIIAAAGPGGGPHVQVFNFTGGLLLEFMAYDVGFRGGVNVAAADFNRDGVTDIITGTGPGGGPHVKVFDGSNPNNLLFNRFVYTPTFLGGVHVAAGDVTGDGIPDIITTPGTGGGPNVKVFDGVTGAVVRDFFAFDPAFRGGVLTSVGDFDGDRFADIVTGAGPGGGPHVKVFSGQDNSVIRSFFAYDVAFNGGVDVSAADLNGDGVDDVIVGPSDGSNRVGRQVFDGSTGAVIQSITPSDLGRGPITTSSTATTPNRNISPYVINPPSDVSLSVGKLLSWTVPSNTFFDANANDVVTLTAYVGDGESLPAWLNFESADNTLTGTPTASDIGSHLIRLVAHDGHRGTSSTSFSLDVNAAAAPAVPTVTTPARRGTVADLTPTFSWTDDPNASQFDLSVVNLGTRVQVIRQKTLTVNSFTPTVPLTEGTYDVRVRAKNANGTFSRWSRPYSITIEINRPARPIPQTPRGAVNTATPEFTWQQDVNTAHVEISIVDASTRVEVARQRNIQATSFTFATSLPAGGYRFNMQAWNEFGERSGWTSAVSFSVNLPVPTEAPRITAPVSDVLDDATPTIAWRRVANAALYNLTVTDLSSSTVVINEVGLNTTSFTPTTPMVDGTYEITVQGTNAIGVAGPTSRRSMTIVLNRPERPVVVSPETSTPNPRT
ncbi:MAG: putative Ig domain-containing protein, partial [Planctomycetota bacterium]|nr:putative Ig domain-containing protein [Planctomycetota bacterium]